MRGLRANRRLLLLRHGKAESPWGVADADRPLAGRGRAQAAYAGQEARAHGVVPDLAIVSPALRARQTWEAFAGAVSTSAETRPEVEVEVAEPQVEVDMDRRVYANTLDDLLDVVTEAPEEVRTLLVVGHNPSIASLATVLGDDPAGAARHGLADGYPTGVLTVFDVAGSWKTVGPGSGRLRAVIRRPS